MTSWRNMISLFLLVFSLIGLSIENCFDYLTRSGMDVVICTLQKHCTKNNRSSAFDDVCGLFDDCFGPPIEKNCGVETHQNISLYHLKCLTAKVMGESLYEGCQYEDICSLYSKLTSLDQSSLSTARPPPPQTWRSSTMAMAASVTTLREAIKSDGSSCVDNAPSILLTFLIISIIFNIVLPLVVYFYMRQRTHIPTQLPHECHNIFTTSADTNPDGCPFEMAC